MKKFLCSLPYAALLGVFLFSCSSDGFKEPKPDDLGGLLDIAATKNIGTCVVEKEPGSKYCYEKISESACHIIGGDLNSSEPCINFTCKWDQEIVKYGRKSTLLFDLGNTGDEDCSWKIYYGNKELDTVSYTISSSTFSDLSHSKDTSIVAKATVTCGENKYNRNCSALKVEKVVVPEVSCNWNPSKVKYGGKSTLSFAFDKENIAQEEGCALEKISYGAKTFKTDTLYTISSSAFSGLSHSKDTSIVAKATVTCGEQDKWEYERDCEELKIDSVPGPKWTGTLSFKKSDYVSNDTNYFFIGTRVDTSYIGSTMEITNKDTAECGNIRIKIDGSPAKLNTPVKATAVVYCKYTDTLELASISAEVLPDPVIGDCVLTGTSKNTMRSNDTLTIGISLDNDYGRCNKEYTLSSSSGNSGYGTSYSFPLANYGNRELSNIYARVSCGTTQTPKKCPTVSVANYKYFTNCIKDNSETIDFTRGKTIVEFACPDSKNGKGDDGNDNPWNAYYITCNGSNSYTVSVDGGRIKEADGYGRSYNFYPDTEPIREGDLYRYPYSIVVDAQEVLKCGIW
jgi:hypothetical protein